MALAKDPFLKASHTIVVSDFHLADAEPPHPGNPLWKRFKRPKHFIDRTFKRFLEHLQSEISDPIELILNGDIFDFDSVMVLPEKPSFFVSWLEKRRGLHSNEEKSRFKIGIILKDHRVWTEAMGDFVKRGNRVVFVIGNHDIELHWPGVQNDILQAFGLDQKERERVRFCEFVYFSNQDTLIEHGNQYDSFCLCQNPLHPVIKSGSGVHVRLPFGNLAGKFMTNGMGLFNPHVDSSFIKSSFKDYIVFFYKDLVRVQPFILLTWFWGAMATLIYSVGEGLLPALQDPLTVEQRVDDVAKRSNTTPRVIRSLRALHAYPAIYNPFRILKELWLDRALLLLAMFLFCFWFFSVSNLITDAGFVAWFVLPFLILFPFFIFYARSVEAETLKFQREAFRKIPLTSQITNMSRVIHGHTHKEMHTQVSGVEHINTGTWSPAFHDLECMKPYGRKCFAWIKPSESSSKSRIAELRIWKDPGTEQIAPIRQPNKKDSKMSYVLRFQEIEKAHRVLSKILVPTPMVLNSWLSERYECEIYLKLETLQPVGSFKIRGATYKISSLSQAEKKKGVIAASLGNHAQGVAWGSRHLGVQSLIVMPETAPLMKVQRTRSLGADIFFEGDSYDEAYKAAQRICKERGMTFVHAFDDPLVAAGQGTVGVEMAKQVSELDYVIGPMGGGGLMAGLAVSAKELYSSVKVIACQAAGASALVQSIRQKKLVTDSRMQTFSDGIAVAVPGESNRKILTGLVDEVLEVEDEDTAAAVLMLIESAKVIAEGAGATPLAGLEQIKKEIRGKKVGVVVSGGNIDLNLVGRIIDRGLIRSGRRLRVNVRISDRVGSLSELTELIAKQGASIVQAIHDRSEPTTHIDQTGVDLTLETRGYEHSQELIRVLRKYAFHVEVKS